MSDSKALDPEDIVEDYTYYPNGLVRTHKDARGHTTIYTYDIVDRPLTETYADSSVKTYIYDDILDTKEVIDEEGNKIKEYYDGLDHLLKQERYEREGDTYKVYSTKRYTYDSCGRKRSFQDARRNNTYYEYDAMGRVIMTVYPDQSYKSILYDDIALTKTIYDANRHQPKVTEHYDCLGRMIKLQEHTENALYITTYSLDKLNQRTIVKDARGQITKYVYDDLNRLITITYPDNKQEIFIYDDAGNLIQKTDRNKNTIKYNYDFANRLISKEYPDTSTVTFTYDKKGNIETEQDQVSLTEYEYNNRDRLIKKTQTIDGMSFVTEYQYDKAGNCTGTKYPNRDEWLYFEYDDLERIKMIQRNDHIYALFDFYPTDHIEAISYGNTVITRYSLDVRNRPTDIKTGYDILSLHYVYDNENNILEENDNTYTYDYLDRLVSASLYDSTLPADNSMLEKVLAHFGYDSLTHKEKYLKDANLNNDGFIDGLDLIIAFSQPQGGRYRITYSYDEVGNRQEKKEGDITTTYGYEYNRLMYAENATENIDYTYDDNGNLIQKTVTDLTTNKTIEWEYTFDYENRLVEVKKDDQIVITCTYNTSGNRIKKSIHSGTPKTIYYHYDLMGNVIEETDETGTITSEHIFGGAFHIAKIENNKTSYYHADHLKSTRALTNEDGQKSWWQDYKPFGNDYKGERISDDTSYTFTDQEKDKETEFFYYGARYYDATAGRFISEDPAEADWNDPQSINRYVYVLNNPLKYNDPYGEQPKLTFAPGMDVHQKMLATLKFAVSVAKLARAGNKSSLVRLLNSNKKVNIRLQASGSHRNGYDTQTKTIDWDPTSAMKIGKRTQSAAMGLDHEAGHAETYLNHPQGAKDLTNIPPGPQNLPEFHDCEEMSNILHKENLTAGELGEPKRYNHGGTPVTVSDPTYHK